MVGQLVSSLFDLTPGMSTFMKVRRAGGCRGLGGGEGRGGAGAKC